MSAVTDAAGIAAPITGMGAGQPATSMQAPRAGDASEEARWQQWKTRGREADARVRQNLRTVSVNVMGAVILAVAVWLSVQMWM